MDDAGRWAIVPASRPDPVARAEHIARTLLRRYGVVVWRLLEREAARGLSFVPAGLSVAASL
jgi:ATP-dependent Lhr-like helicase